jgi:hypothetical protein
MNDVDVVNMRGNLSNTIEHVAPWLRSYDSLNNMNLCNQLLSQVNVARSIPAHS